MGFVFLNAICELQAGRNHVCLICLLKTVPVAKSEYLMSLPGKVSWIRAGSGSRAYLSTPIPFSVCVCVSVCMWGGAWFVSLQFSVGELRPWPHTWLSPNLLLVLVPAWTLCTQLLTQAFIQCTFIRRLLYLGPGLGTRRIPLSKAYTVPALIMFSNYRNDRPPMSDCRDD